MSDQPRIVARAAQPYVAVTERVSLDQLADAIDHGFAEVFGWLAVHEGVSAAGAPLIRYAEVDMADSLLIDVAVPVDGTPPPDERVRAGLLPAGDYVTLLFRGRSTGSSRQMPRCSNGASSTMCDGRWTARLRGARGSSNISPTRATTTSTNTIGIVRVSCWTIVVARFELGTITSGVMPISSLAKLRALSGSPPLHRISNRTSRPSVQPRS